MSINLLCAFCLWTLTKSFQIFGKMRPDIICISEDCGINGSKSMTDTCLVFKCTAFIRSNTHGKDGAENLAEHSITVTLMTSVYLFITTKWHDSAALLGNNIGKYIRGICAFLTICSQSPALWKWFSHLIIHFQFSSGNYCCGAIKKEWIRFCRHCHCNGIGTKHCFSSKGRYHDCFRVGTCHTK